jgi:DNA-binding NarL/FixJ family response regulator
MTVRVLIADDQALVRAGFRKLLDSEPGVDVVGEAVDGLEAVAAVGSQPVDVVLMDVRMPKLDGIEATRRITSIGQTRVLILTTYDLDEYVFQALEAGASGFLLKDAPPDHLFLAIRAVAAGDALLDPAVTRRLVQTFAKRATPDPESQRRLGLLSEREHHVLVLVSRGLSNAEIGTRLFLSESTVKTHVSNVLAKLGVRDRVQAVVCAYENGVVAPGDEDR